jgi:hypothetical protein
LGEEFIAALLRHFRRDGERAIARMARTQPAAYCKLLGLLIPKEHKIEHSRKVSELSDEQLNEMIEVLSARIEARAQGIDVPPLIEITPDGEVRALPAPAADPPKRRNRILAEADTAIGPRERRPRKRKVPPPPGA